MPNNHISKRKNEGVRTISNQFTYFNVYCILYSFLHGFAIYLNLIFRFKRFDNRFIRPYLLRNHIGAEPKILETYSKLAMRDAMEYMRRNASTIGNISNTESMSAIFRNYTGGQLNGRCGNKFITW